ncbi:MAG TPA: DUF177 domain-containing protein [Thermoanaerobaculia bacterium]|mgnify:CR=1 FL=1|nr:DUF177 domain-containing protein [Thermoanaerobaculia bacterium]HUM30891.1 DUF177 domain-containing protein [Thermoanaerobaculia bacterium]HXK69202.1 DUF177 domain-containing protein [Thermoanaerobaculia bacterium]
MSQWRVNLLDIPSEGLPLDGKIVFGEDLIHPDQELTIPEAMMRGIVRKISGGFTLQGNLSFTLELPCSRCLESYPLALSIPFNYRLTRERDDDPGTCTYEDDAVVLDEIMAELVLLNVPMKPLCSESCKGLCPNCGINLNTGSCSCQPPTDPRWGALKNLT